MSPAAELGPTDDPQRPAVVAHDRPVVVDETTAVAGEEATLGRRVHVAPRIDTVRARHVVSVAAQAASWKISPSVVRRPGVDGADAVAHRCSRPPAAVADRMVARGEDHRLTPLDRRRGRAGLGPRPLLDHDELPAGVVDPRFLEPDHDLQREHEVAVQVAVECVPVAWPVAQHQRGGPRLTGVVATPDPLVEVIGPRRVVAAPCSPLPRDREEVGPERGAEVLDDRRQRVREVAVLAPAVPVSGHVDGRPEPPALVVQVDEGGTLRRAEERSDHGNADVVEAGSGHRPVEFVDSPRHRRCRHAADSRAMSVALASTPPR